MGVYIKGITLEQLKNMGIAGVQLNMGRLIEVPEPHGRLIDANSYIDTLDRQGFIRMEEVPSVIEAEGE